MKILHTEGCWFTKPEDLRATPYVVLPVTVKAQVREKPEEAIAIPEVRKPESSKVATGSLIFAKMSLGLENSILRALLNQPASLIGVNQQCSFRI
ncbi:MAG TPA: hypothetical protein DDZ80_19685 [Cyanobacteria bacterium UBA8803]|nr:hypothetical protein [Cyanobacteria bacterium UBA9273]HBL60591.1 hypothetical protein [Cyanobacteria bacterium UBA8803]